jgi:hypothetical protein
VTSPLGNWLPKPVVGAYFEDYVFNHSCAEQPGPQWLDEHNGRTDDVMGYVYHTTPGAFPYLVGPTFFGQVDTGHEGSIVDKCSSSVRESVLEYIEVPISETKVLPAEEEARLIRGRDRERRARGRVLEDTATASIKDTATASISSSSGSMSLAEEADLGAAPSSAYPACVHHPWSIEQSCKGRGGTDFLCERFTPPAIDGEEVSAWTN